MTWRKRGNDRGTNDPGFLDDGTPRRGAHINAAGLVSAMTARTDRQMMVFMFLGVSTADSTDRAVHAPVFSSQVKCQLNGASNRPLPKKSA